MKKVYPLITMLASVLAISSCNKEKEAALTADSSNELQVADYAQKEIASDNKLEENSLALESQAALPDESSASQPEKNEQPAEFDIASEHQTKIQNCYSKTLSPDGEYMIYENGEYDSTYERYCIPVKGERKDFNLIMLKEKCTSVNPDDMAAAKVRFYSAECEFVPIAKSSEPVTYKGITSYWFKITEKAWLPGSSILIQTGSFEKIPAEDFKIGMDYEQINEGLWFIVKTEATLRLTNSSATNKIITIPKGTWLYAEARTIDTETIDGIEERWYKIRYPEIGYVFGGYLEEKKGVPGLNFSHLETFSHTHDDSNDFMFKVYSAPTTESEFLGEYEVKPEYKSNYSTTIESNKKETIDGKEGKWIYITKPVKGFIFGDKFIYSY